MARDAQDRNPLHVRAIPRERIAEAAETLARAFADDPVLRWFFAEAAGDRHDLLRELFRFSCHARLTLGEPLLGAFAEDRLWGVACVGVPEERPWPEALDRDWEETARRIGTEAVDRLERYGDLHDRHYRKLPQYKVIALGVAPDAQGKGCGRALLEAVHALSRAHPSSAGVGLDTENPVNVPFYEHLGYHVIAQDRLDDIDLWFLFRPNDGL